MNNEIKKWCSHFQNTLTFAESRISNANPFFFSDFARVQMMVIAHFTMQIPTSELCQS